MGRFLINGGKKLCGSIDLQGSKNSVLPILAATVLNSGTSVIHNCPDLSDVSAAIGILRYLGCDVTKEEKTVCVNSENVNKCEVPDEMMREMRSSVIFLGAILARCKKASLSMPGGCELGARPIDLHIAAVKRLGAEVREEGGKISASAKNMSGGDIVLSFPSVGATENAMLTATACRGRTRIINAAREPEIEDLQSFLRTMGADVVGAGSSTVVINGNNALHDAEYTVMPDRICAATFMCALAACGGDIELCGAVPEHISTIISVLEGMGCEIEIKEGVCRIKRDLRLSAAKTVRTMPYPGFPTDAQPPLMAASAKCIGTSLFTENIFEGRFRHIGGLLRMGADIKTEGRVALVYGVPELYGASVKACDLRGGAALAIAAASANGESIIENIHYIDRGYENFENSLSRLGADIKRI